MPGEIRLLHGSTISDGKIATYWILVNIIGHVD